MVHYYTFKHSTINNNMALEFYRHLNSIFPVFFRNRRLEPLWGSFPNIHLSLTYTWYNPPMLWPTHHQETIFSLISRKFPRYYMFSDVYNKLKTSTTCYYVIRLQSIKTITKTWNQWFQFVSTENNSCVQISNYTLMLFIVSIYVSRFVFNLISLYTL